MSLIFQIAIGIVVGLFVWAHLGFVLMLLGFALGLFVVWCVLAALLRLIVNLFS